ncbi:G-protein coupled receptor family C group 6 member A isoform X2 [Dromaius novaehollandiae]|uniref:G-protein coupled receptor family C group 6 member A isoform X2 n=1 Tax=Dromaius novaehollandiae TaxID=8790 RepID=UPI00311D3784
MALVSFLIPCLMISTDIAYSCQNTDDFVGTSSPGDIIIGGLFAVHNEMLHPEEHPIKPVIQSCASFEIQVFLQTLAMIHAIEMVNNSTLLPGVTLGYEIYDTCAEVTKTMASTLRFLSKFNSSKDVVEFKCNYSDYIPRIKAVIGASYSEVSMAVSRLLALQLIPQVSPASSAEILSDKIRFPSFLRTVPSDFYQTRAMAHLIFCAHLEYHDFQMCISSQFQENLLQNAENKHQIWRDDFLIANTEPGFIHSTILAVHAIAHAIKRQCKHRNCKDPSAFTPWELLEELKKVTVLDDDKEIKFDSKGDMNTNYDVFLWKEIDGHMKITTMAEYNPEKGYFIFEDKEKEKEFLDLKNVQSTCSQHCRPGEMKKVTESPHTCCYECVYCPENHYSNQTDMDNCYQCNNRTYWAPVNSATCYRKTIHFLSWTEWFAMFLLLLSALGIALILSISVIFTKNLNTPVVKASGGLTVCYIILFSHFLIFLSTVFFIGEPTELKCKTRQAVFGISFTLCVSCILIKSLKILLAFSFDPKLQNFLKSIYKPIPIVVTCTGIQVIICTFWLIFRTPTVKQNFSIPRAIILECNEGSIVAFGMMLGYIAALAFICFIFAFKGRKLPENYNEAKFITFGMLIYFIAWIVFIPVYATTFGKYVPAVEIIVVLISNYGILCCTFLPKCYVIIYKQETNTKSAFLKMIYTYSSKSAGSVTVSRISLDSKSSSSRVTTSDSCKSEKTSANRNCHFQVPGQRLINGKVLPKSTARTLSRKRLSSI